MKDRDRQKGKPYVDYRNTKAIIESLSGMIGGETAYATDNPSAPFGKFGTGTWHWSNNEPGGGSGSGVDQIGIYALDDGVPKGTGTWVDFGNNLSVTLSGTVLRVDATAGGGGGLDTIGFAGLDEGIPIGTGSYLNVTGARATFTRSGTMFNLEISPDPQELIGFYGLTGTTALGTGTTLSVGSYLNFSITGSTFYLSANAGTGSSYLSSGTHTHYGLQVFYPNGQNAAVPGSSTNYLNPYGLGLFVLAGRAMILTRPCIIKNLTATLNSAQPAGGNLVVTIVDGAGSSLGITVTYTPGQSGVKQDLTNIYEVTQAMINTGIGVTIKLANGSASASGTIGGFAMELLYTT